MVTFDSQTCPARQILKVFCSLPTRTQMARILVFMWTLTLSHGKRRRHCPERVRRIEKSGPQVSWMLMKKKWKTLGGGSQAVLEAFSPIYETPKKRPIIPDQKPQR
jgi:hypothetical protein